MQFWEPCSIKVEQIRSPKSSTTTITMNMFFEFRGMPKCIFLNGKTFKFTIKTTKQKFSKLRAQTQKGTKTTTSDTKSHPHIYEQSMHNLLSFWIIVGSTVGALRAHKVIKTSFNNRCTNCHRKKRIWDSWGGGPNRGTSPDRRRQKGVPIKVES